MRSCRLAIKYCAMFANLYNFWEIFAASYSPSWAPPHAHWVCRACVTYLLICHTFTIFHQSLYVFRCGLVILNKRLLLLLVAVALLTSNGHMSTLKMGTRWSPRVFAVGRLVHWRCMP